ncbi:MAG TPA: hypothetical protein VK795_02495 [Terriglobales bacterium]|jgi:hypothetical protein|nr:hypothetical protein [Terriglobales bacterium]
MTIFKRKPAPQSKARPTISSDVHGSENRGALTHRLTRDLMRAEKLAQMLATSRAAAVVDVPDFLAGMYIYEWERLSRFWDEHDEVEALLQRICQISPQRWHHWIEFYDQSRKEASKKPRLFFPEPKIAKKPAAILPRSAELELVLRNSEAIAPHHDTVNGRAIPILTSECVLLCIAFNDGSEIGRHLRETGLDISSLERAARNPRHAPLR